MRFYVDVRGTVCCWVVSRQKKAITKISARLRSKFVDEWIPNGVKRFGLLKRRLIVPLICVLLVDFSSV